VCVCVCVCVCVSAASHMADNRKESTAMRPGKD
jgi:hypothetical protein